MTTGEISSAALSLFAASVLRGADLNAVLERVREAHRPSRLFRRPRP
jgi:hypothetical protein